MWVIVDHEGTRVRLPVHTTAHGVWVGWPGGAALIAPQRPGDTDNVAQHVSDIRAPMTGKIVQVAVMAGQDVKADATLVVLEAMKMEYRLAAPTDATVDHVACAVGDLVDLGTTLIKLSPR